MLPLSLNQAAKACHKSKSAVLEAIKSGQLSAIKNDRNQWCIDPSELFRVYPQNQSGTGNENRHQPGSAEPEENRPTTEILVQILKKEQEERLRERTQLERERHFLESQLEDLKSDRDHWRQQACNLLTHQPEPAQEQELEPVQKTESKLWRKLFGNRTR